MHAISGKKPFRRAAGAAIVAATLAACGGGGGDGDSGGGMSSANSVPDSALVSSLAYTQFAASLAATASETAEPLSADKVGTPPSSETDEPVSVS